MRWSECISSGLVEKRTKDKELAKSLFKMAIDRFEFFSSKEAGIFVLEGIYESILELCHSLLSLEGYKTVSHECAIEFLRGRCLNDYEIELLDKLRKRRHGAKYYGESLSSAVIKRNIENGTVIFQKLKTFVEKKLV
ncbi:hypothetical protein KEJ44_07075 [Candidatus Bathyarchaeota archaeon]|nr:hypothetical protein [Candidatus Bathyarchaeota archaeon]